MDSRFSQEAKIRCYRIYRGVLTGYNEAFIIDNQTKEALIAADSKSSKIIKPILRGRDIQRYHSEWAGLWLIDSHNGYGDYPPVDIEDYPAIKTYLDKFYLKLKKRQDKGVTPYNLRNCNYHEEFEEEKIIWKRIGSILRFSFDDNKMYGLDSACIATGKQLKFLLAVLNSELGNYLLEDSPKTGMGELIVSVQALEPILVPPITDENTSLARKIESLVDRILTAKRAVPTADITNLEEQINSLVYKLYGINSKEIDLIRSIVCSR